MAIKYNLIASYGIGIAYCKCGGYVKQCDNLGSNLTIICIRCKSVYELNFVKVPKKRIDPKWLRAIIKEVQGE
jgi:hypothetical protein